MPFSPHDDDEDFSFLPTVDSVGDPELDKAALWKRYKKREAAPATPPPPPARATPAPPPPPPEPEVFEDPPHYSAEPEAWHSEEETQIEHHLLETHHLDPDPPLHLGHGHSHATEWAEETFRLMEEERGGAEPKSAAPPVVPPPPQRKKTPLVSLHAAAEPVVVAEMRPPPEPEAEELPEAPADNTADLAKARRKAWIFAAAAHLFVALVLTLIHVVPMEIIRPEIVAVSGVDEQSVPQWQKVTSQPQTSAAPSMVAPIVATGASRVAMPQVDFTATASELNMGTSLGSFGAAGGAGGSVSFLGNRGSGKHFVFVVDVSSSMSASSETTRGKYISRFDLMKKELIKSLGQLKRGSSFQVLYFSDFAWPHDQVDSNDYKALADYEWKISPGQTNARIPQWRYVPATPDMIRRSQRIIEDSTNPGSTNWGAGLLMALNGTPRPDVIFFMTDGNKNDAQTWVQEVTNANSRGKRAIIHTTAMMEPGAAEELDELAKRNGGKFTVVLANGEVLQGDEFFKRAGR